MIKANCTHCGKEQDRFMFIPNNNILLCVECWLKDAQGTAKKNKYKNVLNELKDNSNDYRNKYFSGNNSFNSYFNY